MCRPLSLLPSILHLPIKYSLVLNTNEIQENLSGSWDNRRAVQRRHLFSERPTRGRRQLHRCATLPERMLWRHQHSVGKRGDRVKPGSPGADF